MFENAFFAKNIEILDEHCCSSSDDDIIIFITLIKNKCTLTQLVYEYIKYPFRINSARNSSITAFRIYFISFVCIQ